MTPYFTGKGITLYCGDCINLSIECDLIVTDPPYGDGYESGFVDRGGPIAGDDNLPAVQERMAHALTNLRNGRHVYVFGNKLDVTTLPLGGTCELIWDKGILGPGNLAAPWGPQHEPILFGVYVRSAANRRDGKGRLTARLRKGSVLKSQRSHSIGIKHHPNEKPIDILRMMIESSSMLGETVYDPYAGSGSTLIAAALEGRVAVGCELKERICEIAAKRIEREVPVGTNGETFVS